MKDTFMSNLIAVKRSHLFLPSVIKTIEERIYNGSKLVILYNEWDDIHEDDRQLINAYGDLVLVSEIVEKIAIPTITTTAENTEAKLLYLWLNTNFKPDQFKITFIDENIVALKQAKEEFCWSTLQLVKEDIVYTVGQVPYKGAGRRKTRKGTIDLLIEYFQLNNLSLTPQQIRTIKAILKIR